MIERLTSSDITEAQVIILLDILSVVAETDQRAREEVFLIIHA